jgi:hypothetical protein
MIEPLRSLLGEEPVAEAASPRRRMTWPEPLNVFRPCTWLWKDPFRPTMNTLKVRFAQSNNLLYALVLLTVLYGLTASYALRTRLLDDPDLWWHLRTGQWIVEHGALPLTDPFSHTMHGQPWVVYSWLFEVLLYGLFRWCGLLGVVIYTAGLTLALIVALLTLVRRFTPNDTQAVLYTGLGAVALAPFCNPRPWLFTLLLFTIEYTLLLAARQSGRTRLLWWLPPLFALWANLHIQFIYGLFLLGFDTVQPWLEQLLRREFSWPKFRANFIPQRWLLLLLCGLATLVTPYHLKLYQVVFEYAGQRQLYEFITEMQPLNFSSLMPWLVLALTLGAVLRLGWQRLAQPAQFILLLIGVLVAFRSTRDAWFLVVLALPMVAASTLAQARASSIRLSVQGAAILLAVLTLLVLAQRRQVNNTALQTAVAQFYPAAAARVIEERGYTGPLSNHFNWGGYLIWRLPQLPVSMDGRGNVYGAERMARHWALWRGDRRWAQDPELAAAGLVLAGVNQTLCELLRHDQRFEVVYEDQLAALFKARTPPLAQRANNQ